MSPSLKSLLLEPNVRPAVVTDLHQLVADEVDAKSGISGAVVKTGYATVNRLRPQIVKNTLNGLLDQFTEALEPYYRDYQTGFGRDFGAYLAERRDAVAEALLGVTDRRADRSSSEATKAVYRKLRPAAHRHVGDALPRLGALIDRYAAQQRQFGGAQNQRG